MYSFCCICVDFSMLLDVLKYFKCFLHAAMWLLKYFEWLLVVISLVRYFECFLACCYVV